MTRLETLLTWMLTLCVIGFALVFFGTLGLLAWVYTGPRTVPYLPSRIEAQLNGLSQDFKVKLGNLVVTVKS